MTAQVGHPNVSLSGARVFSTLARISQPVTGLRDFLVKGLLMAVRGITRLCDRHHQGAVINEESLAGGELTQARRKS
jgi:hypothetical protein